MLATGLGKMAVYGLGVLKQLTYIRPHGKVAMNVLEWVC
jgi:hypothetical protein